MLRLRLEICEISLEHFTVPENSFLKKEKKMKNT